jgi:retron-type reverse transcriptase
MYSAWIKVCCKVTSNKKKMKNLVHHFSNLQKVLQKENNSFFSVGEEKILH